MDSRDLARFRPAFVLNMVGLAEFRDWTLPSCFLNREEMSRGTIIVKSVIYVSIEENPCRDSLGPVRRPNSKARGNSGHFTNSILENKLGSIANQDHLDFQQHNGRVVHVEAP